MAKSAYSTQEKYELIVAFENRQTSVRDFCRQFNIDQATIRTWIHLFQTYGVEGLNDSSGQKIWFLVMGCINMTVMLFSKRARLLSYIFEDAGNSLGCSQH